MAKFCTKCGKQLAEGEVCFCVNVKANQEVNPESYQENYTQQTQQIPPMPEAPIRTKESEWLQEKTSALMSGTKNMFAEIFPILKAPVTKMRQIAAENNSAIGLELIVAKGILLLVLLLISVNKLSRLMGGYMTVSYLKVIVTVLLFTVGVDLLETVVLKLFTGFANGVTTYSAMITIVGTRTLYEVLIVLVSLIFGVLSVPMGIGFFLLGITLATYMEYSGYQAVAQMGENKKPYIFFIAKACILIVLYLVIDFLMKGAFASAGAEIMNLIKYL